MNGKSHKVLHSISQLHSQLNLKKPTHPLVSVIKAEEVDLERIQISEPVIFNFYVINLKINCKGKIRYGQQFYDFNEGVMTFVAPTQRIELEEPTGSKSEGWMLVIHPDFLHGFPLAKKIREYGFFSYAVSEAMKSLKWRIIYFLWQPMMISIDKAAGSSIKAATAPELEGITGRYFGPKGEEKASEKYYSAENEQRVWDYGMQIIKPYL